MVDSIRRHLTALLAALVVILTLPLPANAGQLYGGADGFNVWLDNGFLYTVGEVSYQLYDGGHYYVQSGVFNDPSWPIGQCVESYVAGLGGEVSDYVTTPTAKGTACFATPAYVSAYRVGQQIVIANPDVYASPYASTFLGYGGAGGWCIAYANPPIYNNECVYAPTAGGSSSFDLSQIWGWVAGYQANYVPGSYPTQSPNGAQQAAIIAAFKADTYGGIDLTQFTMIDFSDRFAPINDWRINGQGTVLCDPNRIANDPLVARASYLLGGIYCGILAPATQSTGTVVNFNLNQDSTSAPASPSATQTYNSTGASQTNMNAESSQGRTVTPNTDLTNEPGAGKVN